MKEYHSGYFFRIFLFHVEQHFLFRGPNFQFFIQNYAFSCPSLFMLFDWERVFLLFLKKLNENKYHWLLRNDLKKNHSN